MLIMLFLMISTVKHCKGDIWIGWDDGWEHHEFDMGNGNITLVNHTRIEIGNPKQYSFNWDEHVTISANAHREPAVGYDEAWRWFYGYTRIGTNGRNRLDIYYISGYPGHYYPPDQIVAWAQAQLGKPYNYDLFTWNHDDNFYCHQLVFRAFWNVAGIYLDNGDDWPPIGGRIIEELDIAHDPRARRRTLDYNFSIQGGFPPEYKEPIEALTVNLLSELERKFGTIETDEMEHFNGAVFGLYKASEGRLYDGEEPNYDEILSFLNQAIEELSYLPKLKGIRGKVISLAHQIMNEKARIQGKGTTLLTNQTDEEFWIKVPSIVNSSFARIEMNLKDGCDFEYRIMDISGRTRSKGRYLGVPKGRNSIEINLDGIPSGEYILNMEIGETKKTEKMIITR